MNYFFVIVFLILFAWDWWRVKFSDNMSTDDLIRAGVDTIVHLILVIINVANIWRLEL